MAIAHVTLVLLYSSVAGMTRKDVLPTWMAVIFGVFSSNNKDPLTIQPTIPVVALQLKIAVDPSVALTDEGVETIAAVDNNYSHVIQCQLSTF